ncbi:molecular chaperone DnaJ [Aster yellows witches'-broom phytoplasma AYWB]|uniref:Chaperone protein DnaJ n=2 Tax=16SrI (Aster yellows group) TaxID=3042590 RepID=Q2NK64_AYWBP|nr:MULTISPECIES: molecular chaperone DnaJ [16SrI (Aster yellows group)]ABC65179.1 molecular chaperone DnaJ [Aster yellows witches'-broom phytoplasma AYWB]PEH36440.1 molecular chaperone DnaJ [New Jersey aster yellows phytoplasma]
MTKKDYYHILGLDKDASPEDIKKAYRILAKKYHPDISKEANAESKFKEVQEAYSVLGDASKKSNYDRFGDSSDNGFSDFGSGGFDGFDSFGDSFFSSFGDIFGNQQTKKPSYDKKVEMTIGFIDSVLGANKTIEITVEADCRVCHGKGAVSHQDVIACRRCGGTGQIITEQRTFLGNIRSRQVCPNCSGKGQEIKNKCYACHGQKRQKVKQSATFNIPAGIQEGMSLQVPGKGNFVPLSNNQKAGDLYITFKVRPHESFVRREYDIILEIFITLPEAVLGTNILIPTIYGEVALKIPSGIQSGNKLRMKNKGVAHLNSSYRKGDQYVVVHLKTPNPLSLEEKRLYQKLLDLQHRS